MKSRKLEDEPNRRSFVKMSALNIFAAQTFFYLGLQEVLRVEKSPEQVYPRYNKNELLRLLTHRLHLQRRNVFAGDMLDVSENTEAGSSLEPVIMMQDALDKILTQGEKAIDSPAKATNDFGDVAQKVAKWFASYRTSLGEEISKDDADCNDHANRACEIFHAQGLQSYLASMWPEDPSFRLDPKNPWHQIAVLRTGESEYIVVDNNIIHIVHGSFASFITSYHKTMGRQTSVRLMPLVGLSEYKKPKYDYPTVKMAHQIAYAAGTNETNMEIAALHEPSPSRHNFVASRKQ